MILPRSPAVEHVIEAIQRFSGDEVAEFSEHLHDARIRHELETKWNVDAEVVLEAIHRAPDLTQRMLKGVIADAAFGKYVLPELTAAGSRLVNIALDQNLAYDYLIEHSESGDRVSVQVKLQRSLKLEPHIRKLAGQPVYVVEVQKTRSGKRKAKNGGEEQSELIDTRPYHFGEFDVLAVCLWPSTNVWGTFRYTLARWLAPRIANRNLVAVMQVVAQMPDGVFWTDDFDEVVRWHREGVERDLSQILAFPQKPPQSEEKKTAAKKKRDEKAAPKQTKSTR